MSDAAVGTMALLGERKRVLLAMLGGRAPPPLAEHAWDTLDAMAAQHRLQPLLAYRLDHAGGAWPVPDAVARSWREARRQAGLASLRQQAALRLAGEALTAAAIPFCALKGPRLAWRSYPEPALRPMRDLDLLVAADQVLRGAEVLQAAGFAMSGDAAVLAEAIGADKHLPAMVHAGLGVAVELHHRLTDPPGQHGYRVPQLAPEALLARCEPVALGGFAVPCPAPTDLVAHLMVHALYGHRLDCGPLVLADLHYLLAAEPVEPGKLWQQAREGGWERGAALLLALTERHFGATPLRHAGAAPLPPAVLAAAEHALLQDLASRGHGEALADLFAARSPRALAGAIGKRLKPARHVLHDEGRGMPGWRFWPGWAWRRLRRLAARLTDRRAGSEALETAALMRWLQP